MGAMSIGLARGTNTVQLDGSSFQNVNPLWFAFYLIAMDYPRTHLTTAQSSVGVARSEEDMEFAYVGGKL